MATMINALKRQDPPGGGATDGLEDGGWRAFLKLGYAFKDGRSLLFRQQRQGPLFVQKPFYPEGPRTCHTYILHPPGGVVGGDRLDLALTLESGSQCLVTTPAAGKFYRSPGPDAMQVNRLNVAEGAVLEWLPQETIIYNGSRARMRTIVMLAAGARFIGWEMFCLGLPASAQPFASGRIDQHLEVRQAGKPLLIECLRIESDDSILKEPWAMGGHPVTGTMVATTGDVKVTDAVREKVCVESDDGLFAVTGLNGLTLCRFLGDDVYKGLRLFRRAWEVLRPVVKGGNVCTPRIWET